MFFNLLHIPHKSAAAAPDGNVNVDMTCCISPTNQLQRHPDIYPKLFQLAAYPPQISCSGTIRLILLQIGIAAYPPQISCSGT